LVYAFRGESGLDLQVSLKDASGVELAANNDASPEQVEAYSPPLKTTNDAIIQNVILPADGIYTITARPEPLSTATQLRETINATNNAYNAFLFGPLSRLNRWVIWIRDALTLIMLGLAVAIVFRAEQFSLGAEGQLYFGALVSAVIGLSFGNVPKSILVPVALLSAATAGFLWGLLPGALKAYLGANELVSTLMLNTIATRFYEMVLTFQLKPPDAGYTSSEWIPDNGLLTPIIDVSGDQITIAVYILIALVVLTWLLIQRTPLGYEIRMIGANIKFANYGGVNTRRTIMLAMAISGAVAGLTGAHLAMGIHRKLILNISVGLAFEGVVVALLARNNPLVVPFTGLLYAYLRTGAQMMERDANISAEVVRIIQAVVILLITAEALVAFFQQRRLRQRDRPAISPGDTSAKAEGGAD
jgi:simple sugar transport system permease protein